MAESRLMIGNVGLDNFLIFLFVLFLSIAVGRLLNGLIRKLLDLKIGVKNSKLFARFVQYIISIGGLYTGLFYFLGLDLTAIAASLGIVSIIIAFSSQQIIQNFISGVLVTMGSIIQVEDWIETGNSGVCRVKDIRLTNTLLRNVNGRLIYVPNSYLLNNFVINYTQAGFFQVPIDINLPGSSDFPAVKKIIIDVADKNKKILPSVSRSENIFLKRILELSRIQNLFNKKFDQKNLEPEVLITNISSNITISIRIWIREVNMKDQIVSDFLDELRSEFKKQKII